MTAPAPTDPAPGMISAASLASRPIKRRDWYVEDLVPGRQVTQISGDGGLGKSTLALQLAVASVTGREWLGRTVARGPVISLAAEDDLDELQRRVDAIAVHYEVGLEALADLHLWPLAAGDPALYAPNRGDGLLQPTERWRELTGYIERVRPRLVVLDSRADVFGGSEIDREQVRRFIGALRRTALEHDLAILILAHPSLSGMSSGSGSSGSTHWRNAVRSDLYLTRPDGDYASPDARVLTPKKMNYAAIGHAMNLRWSCGAFVLDGEQSAATAPAEAKAEAEAVFLRLLTRFNEQGRRVGATPAANYAPTLFAREEAAQGYRKPALQAAMGRLLDAGQIVLEETGSPSRRRQHLVVKG